MTRSVSELRQRLSAQLAEDYAASHIEVEEFERGVERMEDAESEAELLAVARDFDLPAVGGVGAERSVQRRSAPDALVPARDETRWVIAVMGGVERAGVWEVPSLLRTFAMMGGVALDFRGVQLPVRGARLQIFAMMGGVEVIVPVGARVQCTGVAIMGGFEQLHPPEGGRQGPLLTIAGFALMGGVSVESRLPGETARQARKRRKLENRSRLPFRE